MPSSGSAIQLYKMGFVLFSLAVLSCLWEGGGRVVGGIEFKATQPG